MPNEEELSKLERDIEKVEQDIAKVENEIAKVEKKLDVEGLSPEDKAYYREEKKQLREEKKQLREEKKQLRAKEERLQEEARLQSSQGRPPLHPGTDTNEMNLKLDKLLEASALGDRATPQYSPAQIGRETIRRLKKEGRFFTFEEKQGLPCVLSRDQAEELARMDTEHQVVAYITPYLESIAQETISCAVFNSEEYTWVETSSETSAYNKKPDLIISHPCLVTSKPPFATDQRLNQLRRETDKFGVLSNWKLRRFIGATCEAKQAIDNQAFGEVINYGAHICFGKHGAVTTRLILFDKQVFWLVESVKGAVARVETCHWTDQGSRNLLCDFIMKPTLLSLVSEACQHFNLKVEPGSFLGAGAFGYVFRAQRVSDAKCLALKIVMNIEGINRLEVERAMMLQAKAVCPDEVMGLEKDGYCAFEEEGAAMLLSDIGGHFSQLPPQCIVDSLRNLHKNGIIHGDARLENVVCVDGRPCWIDFAESRFFLGERNQQTEMEALISEVKDRFGYVAL